MTITERFGLRDDASLEDIVFAINELLNGHDNACGEVTLNAGQTTTVVTHYECNSESKILLCPKTQTAATAIGGGHVYVTPGTQQFTINHDNTADADRTYMYVVRGG